MTPGESIEQYLMQSSPSFEAERLILRTTENITRVDLAKSIGKSKGHISQLLNGKRNMTLRTLAEIAFALNVRVAIDATNLHGSRRERTRKTHRQYSAKKDIGGNVIWPRMDQSLLSPLSHGILETSMPSQVGGLVRRSSDLRGTQVGTFEGSNRISEDGRRGPAVAA